MENDIKIAYNRLISRKNTMFFVFPPIGLVIHFSIIGFFNITNPIIIVVIGTVIAGLADSWFREINVCPFCKNPFFLQRKDGTRDISFNIFTQTKCINCKEPKDIANH